MRSMPGAALSLFAPNKRVQKIGRAHGNFLSRFKAIALLNSMVAVSTNTSIGVWAAPVTLWLVQLQMSSRRSIAVFP